MKNAIKRMLKLLRSKMFSKTMAFYRYPVPDPINNAHRILSPKLLETVKWEHNDTVLEQLQHSRYYNIWKKFEGGYKKYSYFELYDRLFSEFSNKKPRVLEIGVYKGASIHAWKEFFGEGARIVGVDIDQSCVQFEDSSNEIYVRIGDQSDPQFLKRLSDEFGKFDIIIDDGSHLTHHVIATFNYAFLHCLAENGIYFIEDLNTSYWTDYRTSKYSAMDMVLSLCEMTQHFYFANPHQNYVLDNYKNHYISPLINTIVSEVRVFDSAAAIYKKTHYPPLVFQT